MEKLANATCEVDARKRGMLAGDVAKSFAVGGHEIDHSGGESSLQENLKRERKGFHEALEI